MMNSLPGQIIGHNIIYLDSVTSTNDHLKSLAAGTLKEGSVVVAETQTRGRGRNDKKWISPPGKGLTFSVFLRPEINTDQMLIFSYLPVIVVTKFLNTCFNISASVKWPNDVYAQSKKIAGILSESSSYKNSLKYFITGIGINLNHNINDFGGELHDCATSLSIILKKFVDNELFLFNFLKEFDFEYKRIIHSSNWENDIVAEWNQLCHHMNSRVRLMDNKKNKEYGIFKGITRSGEALIKTDRNIIKTVNIDHFSLRDNYVISN